MGKEYFKPVEEVVLSLGSSYNGLTSSQATEKEKEFGPNKLKEGKKESLFHKFLQELSGYMTVVLIIAAIISGFASVCSGEGMTDTFIILAVVVMNAMLGVFQESKAEEAICSLQQMSAATCRVIRDGNLAIIESESLVPGDIVLLEAGDSIPADGRVIECASLKVEEAALTGESVAVEKGSEVITDDGKTLPLGDRKNMVYMGSSVVYGRGKAVICRTGMDTELGKIAGELTAAKKEETPLQIKLNKLSKTLSVLVLLICAVIFLSNLGRVFLAGRVITQKELLDMFIVAVSLAVAAIPEGLSAVVTVLLSAGVTKMSKKRAIVRKLTAVETLGCTQVVCTDKTGTLTQNKMTVVQHETDDDDFLMKAMAMCSDAEVNEKNGDVVGEPTEAALVSDAYKNGINKNELKSIYKRVGEAPFDSVRKMMSTVNEHLPSGKYVQFTKGAPDEVLKRCTKMVSEGNIVELTDDVRKKLLRKNKEMADKALRVLCAATKEYESMPDGFTPDILEKGLTYVGMCGMMDPARPEAKSAIARCKAAGIRPIMITGDHKDTAIAIAKELGILEDGQKAITGAELDEISKEDFIASIEDYSVYARVQPEHKVRIVKAWKESGHVVSMTGDGANDAPSIKNADIGIGMGITGTDVTKNVADMVLADDNFATIIEAVAEGRRIYDNIQKAIQFLLSSNLAEVFAVFVSSMLGFTVLKPAHLLWVNLMTDSFPAIGLGMEEEETGIMNRPPRNKKDGILSGGMGPDVVLQGAFIAILTLAAYFIGHFMEIGRWEIAKSPDGMTMAFLTLSLTEMFHSFNMKSRSKSIFKTRKHNPVLFMSLIFTLTLTTMVISVPFFRNIFELEEISILEYFVAAGIAFLIIPVVEIQKLMKKISKGSTSQSD